MRVPAVSDLWADFEAAPLNMWVIPGEAGAWCDTCHLPSAVQYAIVLDPAKTPETWSTYCPDCRERRAPDGERP